MIHPRSKSLLLVGILVLWCFRLSPGEEHPRTSSVRLSMDMMSLEEQSANWTSTAPSTNPSTVLNIFAQSPPPSVSPRISGMPSSMRPSNHTNSPSHSPSHSSSHSPSSVERNIPSPSMKPLSMSSYRLSSVPSVPLSVAPSSKPPSSTPPSFTKVRPIPSSYPSSSTTTSTSTSTEEAEMFTTSTYLPHFPISSTMDQNTLSIFETVATDFLLDTKLTSDLYRIRIDRVTVINQSLQQKSSRRSLRPVTQVSSADPSEPRLTESSFELLVRLEVRGNVTPAGVLNARSFSSAIFYGFVNSFTSFERDLYRASPFFQTPAGRNDDDVPPAPVSKSQWPLIVSGALLAVSLALVAFVTGLVIYRRRARFDPPVSDIGNSSSSMGEGGIFSVDRFMEAPQIKPKLKLKEAALPSLMDWSVSTTRTSLSRDDNTDYTNSLGLNFTEEHLQKVAQDKNIPNFLRRPKDSQREHHTPQYSHWDQSHYDDETQPAPESVTSNNDTALSQATGTTASSFDVRRLLPLPTLDSVTECSLNVGEQHVACYAPPGPLGVVINNSVDGPMIHHLKATSPMMGKINRGDVIVEVDDIDTRGMTAAELTGMMADKSRQPYRKIVTLVQKMNEF